MVAISLSGSGEGPGRVTGRGYSTSSGAVACPTIPGRGSCCDYGIVRGAFFWVNDIEALYGELTLKGARVVYPPVIQPYRMKEFAVRDPNGHVLGFGQEWPPEGARS